MKLSIPEEAVADAVAIRTWLLERSPCAAVRFDEQLGHTMRLILEHEAGGRYLDGYRRVLFFRRRYMVIYSMANEMLIVRNVADCRREPGYWLDNE